MALAWGVLIGGIIQLGFQIPFLRKIKRLPKLQFGDTAPNPDEQSEVKNIQGSREHLYPNVYARFMYLVTIKDIKVGEELAANYNLYTYPKTGVGVQSF